MKKKLVLLAGCASLILLIGGIMCFVKGLPKCGLLRINGIDITKENVMINSDYAELPLTEVMKNLDMKVNWVDDNTADITYKDNKYTLDLTKISLVEVEQYNNLLLCFCSGNADSLRLPLPRNPGMVALTEPASCGSTASSASMLRSNASATQAASPLVIFVISAGR